MKLYKVRAKALFGNYVEVVEVEDGFKEKGDVLTKERIRIARNDLGVIRSGNMFGSYYSWAEDESQIQEVRERIHHIVRTYNEKELVNFRKNVEACDAFDVKSPPVIRTN